LRRCRLLRTDHPRATFVADVQIVLQQALALRDRHRADAGLGSRRGAFPKLYHWFDVFHDVLGKLLTPSVTPVAPIGMQRRNHSELQAPLGWPAGIVLAPRRNESVSFILEKGSSCV
jgi:hypothetical protein